MRERGEREESYCDDLDYFGSHCRFDEILSRKSVASREGLAGTTHELPRTPWTEKKQATAAT
jgi:hypothetical protein